MKRGDWHVHPREAKVHNYLKKLAQMEQRGQVKVGPAGSLNNMTVRHDDWCGVYKGEECNCDPNIEFEADVNDDQFLAHAMRPHLRNTPEA